MGKRAHPLDQMVGIPLGNRVVDTVSRRSTRLRKSASSPVYLLGVVLARNNVVQKRGNMAESKKRRLHDDNFLLIS